MYLSDSTLEILKNFSQIKDSILFKEGNVLNTCTTERSVLAKAVLEDYFPQTFGIYELKTFLSLLTLGASKPMLDIKDDYVLITNEETKSTVSYRTAEESLIRHPKFSELDNSDTVVEFKIDENILKWVISTSRILRSDYLRFVGDGKCIKMISASRESSNKDQITICESDVEFDVMIELNLLNVIMGAYTVKIDPNRFIYMKKDDMNLEYWIALKNE